ncbi:hypothetical protein KUV80_07190 [Fictibacillus nanhaiensis]|uniref:hypothetical protein n=1 Tax=Fictibacillus nanhaiensis TaxID=742169 RepID=UPI001C94B926|nr:hypothetical protein [Fictibacillus nanhaiensis]MBY6036431.1 hypothetical protein [Fictibacillus nanhaiensis]
MTKKTWLTSYILALAVILSACSSEGEELKSNAPVEKTGESAQQQKDQKSEPPTEEITSIEEEGIYVGQVDSNSIEVQAGGETLVLRLTDDVRETVAGLEDGAKVSIVYKKNENEQWVLENITAADSDTNEKLTTKLLQFMVNDSMIEKEASLTESEQDYYFYKVEDFEFTAEEPRKDLLFASAFAETFVRIEPLSPDASLDDLKKWANEELSAIGKVKEVDGSETAGPAFKNTSLFLTASKDSFKKYIVIQELKSGDMMKYTINLPQHEKSVEWEQAVWAMLATLQKN